MSWNGDGKEGGWERLLPTFLRRKCVSGCIFAPYFDPEGGAGHFAAVHRVFGASNASKLLQRVPPHRRLHAVLTMCYEAHARLRDPVFGCVAHVFALQQQVVSLEAELGLVQARLSAARSSSCAAILLQAAAAAKTLPRPELDGERHCAGQPVQQPENDEVETLVQEYFAKYLQSAKLRWPDSL
ncbi:unnamed protein product [Spirodela intermedia]|uniref:LOB domain-containing protein n=1 Tax=Spirodela intermedia TaxID=51605 RepID=A0A7I8IGT2_SPIIN|nr:unnamed protein product [Spirodela intermedia]CAA6656273.1 unnamed protein product [Spirodela intermedia]